VAKPAEHGRDRTMMTVIGCRALVLSAFAVPVVGVVAPKGIVVVLLIAGAAGIAAWAKEGRPRLPVDRRLILLLAALAVWAAMTAAWAFVPVDALALVAKLVAIAVAGLGVMFAAGRLEAEHRASAENALAVGMIAGLAAFAVGFVYARATGDSLWGSYKTDPLTTLKTGAVVLGLVAWPAAAAAWRRGWRLATGIVGLAVYVAGALVSSGTALVAPLVGLAGFAVVRLWGRRGAWFLAAVSVVAALTAPQVLSSRTFQDTMAGLVAAAPSSASHRLKIWDFVAGKIDEKPLLGWGMDGSRWIPKDHRRLGPETEILPLHPHNAFLQVRVELGVPGAVIFALLLGAFFAGVVGAVGDRFAGAVMAGTASAYLTVASVSYGIWQNWWVAFGWVLAVLTATVLRPPSIDAGSRPQTGG